jgi:hypothetical protein
VRLSQRLGARRPFAEVVSCDVLEREVRNYLQKQAAILEQLWDTVITDAMLAA